ncbi:MAG: hypothetical protein PVH00_13785, partial [Gemmatimonadota bacterium]
MTRPRLVLTAAVLAAMSACGDGTGPGDDLLDIDRHEKIPADAVKGTPATDPTPPILHSAEFLEPVPVPVISTAGAEDAPFIPVDGSALYFYFGADVREDASIAIRDPVNGIWVARSANGTWQQPTLVQLQNSDELALNGCPFVDGEEMLFCTARGGYTGVHWFRAEYSGGRWRNWELADFPAEYDVGELHIEGDELYYGSARAGGSGGQDIWRLTRNGDGWADPVNITAVNTAADETRPYVTPGGGQLWITRTYQGTPAIYRSKRVDGAWQPPELILSQFAGEPTLDPQGNVYFVHHYFV